MEQNLKEPELCALLRNTHKDEHQIHCLLQTALDIHILVVNDTLESKTKMVYT